MRRDTKGIVKRDNEVERKKKRFEVTLREHTAIHLKHTPPPTQTSRRRQPCFHHSQYIQQRTKGKWFHMMLSSKELELYHETHSYSTHVIQFRPMVKANFLLISRWKSRIPNQHLPTGAGCNESLRLPPLELVTHGILLMGMLCICVSMASINKRNHRDNDMDNANLSIQQGIFLFFKFLLF
jgi:hypothetical protein